MEMKIRSTRERYNRDIRQDVLFLFGEWDLKRAALRSKVKKCPVDTFLARGKVPLFPGAVRRTVNGNEDWIDEGAMRF